MNQREKFRLRFYNEDTNFIRLEKKSKINGLCRKESVTLTAAQVEELLAGEMSAEAPLTRELLVKMRSQGLKPKTLVEYTREAYIFAPGNVRVTLDYNIRTGLNGTDFLNPDCILVPAKDAPAILEAKWDEYLQILFGT